MMPVWIVWAKCGDYPRYVDSIYVEEDGALKRQKNLTEGANSAYKFLVQRCQIEDAVLGIRPDAPPQKNDQ